MSKVKKQEKGSGLRSRRASMPVLGTTDRKEIDPYIITWFEEDENLTSNKFSLSVDDLDDNVFSGNKTLEEEKAADDDANDGPSIGVAKQSKKSKILSTLSNFRRGSLTGFKKEPKDFNLPKTNLYMPTTAEVICEPEEEVCRLPKFDQNKNLMIYRAKDEAVDKDESSVGEDNEEYHLMSDNDNDGHVNLLFEFDEDLQPAVNMTQGWTFGKKGNGIGDFQDACHVNYVSKAGVYVTDMVGSRITIFNSSGSPLAAFHGEEIIEPWACALTHEGHIAVTSRKEKRIVVFSKNGNIVRTFGHGFFGIPSGIAVNKEGQFIISDIETNQVSIHDKNGKWIKYLGSPIKPEQKFKQPRYVATSSRYIIVSDSGNNCIKMFDEKGHFIRKIGKFGSQDGDFKYPYGVCTDNLGDIYVADHYNNRISMFSRDGEFVRHLVTSQHSLKLPQGIALSPELNLYVSHGGLKACEVSVFKLQCHSSLQLSSDMEVYL